MNTQPEALRLADALTAEPDCTCHAVSYYECSCDAIWPEQWVDHAAAELRRLFKTGLEVADRADGLRCENELLKAQRDALLEALKVVIDDLMYKDHARVIDVARAAIAKAEGEKT